MQNLGSYISSYSDNDRFINNINEIINFPEDQNAQIKANNWGTLGRGDGKVAWVVNYANTQLGLATELSGTIKVIDETFKNATEQFENDYQKLTKESLNPENLGSIKDSFQKEISMLQGLRNISNVYHARYDKAEKEEPSSMLGSTYNMFFAVDKTKKQDGLQQLDNVVKTYEAITSKHGQQFTKLIETYKQKHETLDLTASVMFPKPMSLFTDKDATMRLDAFLAKWSPQISREKANKYIEQGKAIAANVLDGKITKGTTEDVTALSWYLMHLAINKKQGHSDGAFAIEDKDERLYNFLLNVDGCGDRPSTHYIGRGKEWTGLTKFLSKSSHHKGIDVVSGELPAEKRHILFGQVDKDNLLFIKLENFSPFATTGYGYDMALHGADLAIAQYNKAFYPGSDDLPVMFKERVPVATLDEFKKILKTIDPIRLEEINKTMAGKGFTDLPEKAAKTYGIAYMTSFMRELDTLKNMLVNYNPLNFYASLPQLDHMDKRTGKEVYLSGEEMLPQIL